MARRYKLLFLSLIIASYALMQLATTKKCDTPECRALNEMNEKLHQDHSYVLFANRCDGNRPDTLCVYVDQAQGVGIDWNAFADTACTIATQSGLAQQYMFVIAPPNGPGNFDTLAQKQCP